MRGKEARDGSTVRVAALRTPCTVPARMAEDRRTTRSLFAAGARRRSQAPLEVAAASASAEPEAKEAGPPPLPARSVPLWAMARSNAGSQGREASPEIGPPPPIPPRSDSAMSSPSGDGLERTRSPPGWPSLHELVPPVENDNFVSPRTESFQSARGSPVAVPAGLGGWYLQASPRGGSLVLPGTPAAVSASVGPRNASLLARSLSALSTASPAGTPRLEPPHSPHSPKQLAAAAAALEAKLALERAEAATSTAAHTMELARQTARVRHERQRGEEESRRSLGATSQARPLQLLENFTPPGKDSGNENSSSARGVMSQSFVPDGAADNDVSMAVAAGEAISSLLAYLQSSTKPKSMNSQTMQSSFPSPSGLTFTGRQGPERDRTPGVEPKLEHPELEPQPEPIAACPPPRSPSPSTQTVEEDSELDSENAAGRSIDPDLWARSVKTALAFRGFTQGVRASLQEKREISEHSEPVPPTSIADTETSDDKANIAAVENRQHQQLAGAERVKAIPNSTFIKNKLVGDAAVVETDPGRRPQATGLVQRQHKQETVVGPSTAEELKTKTADRSGGKLIKKREDRRTHTQQPRAAEQQQECADGVSGSEHEQLHVYEQDRGQEHSHWSRRTPETAAARSRSPRIRRRAPQHAASPHNVGVRAVSNTRNDNTSTTMAGTHAKRLKMPDEEQVQRSRAQEAAQKANAQLRADRERRSRSASAQRTQRAKSPASISARDRSLLTPQEIAKAEFRSYRRAKPNSVTDSGSWHVSVSCYTTAI